MNFDSYKEEVSQIAIGKKMPDAVYLHRDALLFLSDNLRDEVSSVESTHSSDFEWNIVKLYRRDHRISFLNYPDFFEDSYPALDASLTVDLVRAKSRKTSYKNSENPPILHRKETFISECHPHYKVAKSITQEGEEIGLYANTKRIGYRKNWEKLIADKGYVLIDGHLARGDHKLAQAHIDTDRETSIKRHRTAINRDRLSSPMQGLARHGFLEGRLSVFDYGCGKGDDLLELEAHGLDVSGWDPVFKPDAKKQSADIVNLGFVINVIEDREERVSVLKDASGLAKKLLVVSAMLGRESTIGQFKSYKDGVITSRDTFQKYYSQAELKEFIESAVGEQAFAVAPGVFFIFNDELEAQTFLSNRQRVQRNWRQLTVRPAKSKTVDIEKYVEENRDLIEGFWNCCLSLGRLPANDEYERSEELRRKLGSHGRAFEAIGDLFDREEFSQAREDRIEDLVVYMALSFFGRRKAYKKMPASLQRDIKSFFGKQSIALEIAKKSLFSIAKVEAITEACFAAREQLQEGRLESDHSYVIHRSALSRLPGILRIYVGCALELYGDLDGVDLIKIHMQSGKVSLMIYDEFTKKLPILKQRIKIKLREQAIDWFYYDNESKQQPLYLKSAYLNPEHPAFVKQQEFDRAILNVPGIDLSEYGPSYLELNSMIEASGQKLASLVGNKFDYATDV